MRIRLPGSMGNGSLNPKPLPGSMSHGKTQNRRTNVQCVWMIWSILVSTTPHRVHFSFYDASFQPPSLSAGTSAQVNFVVWCFILHLAFPQMMMMMIIRRFCPRSQNLCVGSSFVGRDRLQNPNLFLEWDGDAGGKTRDKKSKNLRGATLRSTSR